MKTRVLLAYLLIGTALLPAAASAQDADYYKGKLMKLVVPYDPGGTYDLYCQAFSKHFGKHIPGKPTIIVQHMPGAGGAKAMNWSYVLMPKDGLNLLTPLDNTVVNQLLLPEQSRYDARKFTWIGSSNQTNIVMVVRSDTGIRSWQDMKGGKEWIGSSGGSSDTGFIGPRLAAGVLGLKLRMVTGYKGSNAAMFAIEQRESDFSMYNWLAWVSREKWFKGEQPFARPILQIGNFKDPDLPDSIPLLHELVTNEQDKKVVAFIASLGGLGRGLALPPGAPDHAVKTLRAAYDKMNADPQFASDLKKRNLRLIPTKGETLQQIVVTALDNATPEVVARARKIIYGK